MSWKRHLRHAIPPRWFKRLHVAYWREHKDRYVAEHCRAQCHNLGIPPAEAYGRREEFYRYVHDAFVGDEPIDYLEFGVFRGETMDVWRRLNRHPESRFYGFDTFEGLPERWKDGFEAGHFSTGGAMPDIDDERVSFVKGLFQDTLEGAMADLRPSRRLVVHIDSDLYASALYILTTLDPRLSPGTLVLFDQWSGDDEYRAFADYVAAYRRNLVARATMNDHYSKIVFRVEDSDG